MSHHQVGDYTPGSTKDVLEDVEIERLKQHQKWGEQNHDMYRWLAILSEEVGEVGKAMLETEFGGKHASEIRAELVQVAAVAVAIIECFDRHQMALAPEKNSGIAFSTVLGDAAPKAVN